MFDVKELDFNLEETKNKIVNAFNYNIPLLTYLKDSGLNFEQVENISRSEAVKIMRKQTNVAIREKFFTELLRLDENAIAMLKVNLSQLALLVEQVKAELDSREAVKVDLAIDKINDDVNHKVNGDVKKELPPL